MTATEQLRKLLDERGIEYSMHEDSWAKETYWIVDHNPYRFSERSEYGTCMLHNITPEQAIAATLGGDDKSRWFQLFGTPERAARTISVTATCMEPTTVCPDCIYKDYCDTECSYDALLEWLGGEDA